MILGMERYHLTIETHDWRMERYHSKIEIHD